MDHSELTDREWAMWRALTLMSRQLASAMDQRLRDEAGISSPEFEILHALSTSPGHQARARELAEMLSWEKSRISHQVTRMVDRGLVARAECATDLRGTWVALAPLGAEALAKAMPGYSEELRSRFTSVVDDVEAVQFTGVALRVIAATDPTTCQVEIDRIHQAVAGSINAR